MKSSAEGVDLVPKIAAEVNSRDEIDSLPDVPSIGVGNEYRIFEKEWSLWDSHPQPSRRSSDRKPARANTPFQEINNFAVDRCDALFGTNYQTSKSPSSFDLTTPHEILEPQKDIGHTALVSPPKLPRSLQSSEQ